MSIQDFKSNLRGGVAAPNRFEVVVEFPAFAGGADVIRQTAFLANSTSLPPSTLGITEVPFRGRQLKLAGDRTFGEWTVNFVNDNSFGIRDAFERWSNGINGVNSNTGLDVPDEYMGTFSVYQLDRQDNRIKEYVLKLAFPSEVGEIEVAQDSNDSFEQFSVTVAYSDLSSNTTT